MNEVIPGKPVERTLTICLPHRKINVFFSKKYTVDCEIQVVKRDQGGDVNLGLGLGLGLSPVMACHHHHLSFQVFPSCGLSLSLSQLLFNQAR